MAETTKPAAGKAGGNKATQLLNRKVAGLPGYVWLGVVIVGAFLLIRMRQAKAAAAGTADDGTTADGLNPATSYGNGIPYTPQVGPTGTTGAGGTTTTIYQYPPSGGGTGLLHGRPIGVGSIAPPIVITPPTTAPPTTTTPPPFHGTPPPKPVPTKSINPLLPTKPPVLTRPVLGPRAVNTTASPSPVQLAAVPVGSTLTKRGQ